MEPQISVILPVYNQQKYIAGTIESVLCQTFSDFEFLIVDDGSTDGSAQIIKDYAAKDRRIIPYFERNSGKCKATNFLVAKAKGKWCAFLDADDQMLPDRLARQIEFHNQNPLLQGSSGHSYYINEKNETLGMQKYPHLKSIEECDRVRKTKDYITCAFTSLMMSTKAYLDAGGLPENIWPCEDFEFFNRFVQKGYNLVIMQEPLMKYRIHGSSITAKNPLKVYDMIGYVMHCLDQRKESKPEISFDEFMAIRDKDSWWVKLNRRSYNYSQIFFRNAGVALMSKQYVSFLWQVLISTLFSPAHIFSKIRRLV
jgi:glycosyltransferase involved in cell wall biosynthesis